MELNQLRNEIFELATRQGFHGVDAHGINQDDLCRKLMLVTSELCEAMEAERNGKVSFDPTKVVGTNIPSPAEFASKLRGSIEEEIADAVIRLADIAGMLGMDLDWWVRAKMEYNYSRPYKHQKEY